MKAASAAISCAMAQALTTTTTNTRLPRGRLVAR